MTPRWIPGEEVARHLPYAACIPLMRQAMIALSQGRTRQLLRSIIDLPGGRAFGVMRGGRERRERRDRTERQAGGNAFRGNEAPAQSPYSRHSSGQEIESRLEKRLVTGFLGRSSPRWRSANRLGA